MLRLVDCSLLVPPQAGPDGRSRYAMLETLRAYGAGLLAEAGEQDRPPPRWPGTRCEVAEQAAAGLQTSTAGRWPPRGGWMPRTPPCGRSLAWAMDHDPAIALRLAAALGWWWLLRGRLAGQYALLREAAGRAEAGSDGWCAVAALARHGRALSGDLAGALGHFTALRDAVAGPGAVPGAG